VLNEPVLHATILVVDDEEAINRLVTRFFTHIGYNVVAATSGEEALTIVRRRRPPIDLVLSDVVMPGMDGTELVGWVLAECPGPAVILMTGQLPDEVERVSIGGHIVRVLHKPLNLDHLEELLRLMLPTLPRADKFETPRQTG
jgi:CheY-like chemotaxis protein